MSFASTLLTPAVLLLSTIGVSGASQDLFEESGTANHDVFSPDPGDPETVEAAAEHQGNPPPRNWPFRFVATSFRPLEAYQVRIEQRMTIRITPRSPAVRPNFFTGLPRQAIGAQLVERRIGKCVQMSGISGVQADGGDRLILFMSDRRVVSAQLERACRARDFYSGFYLARSQDGKLCVDRDTLQSRSGANCRLTRIRQLVDADN